MNAPVWLVYKSEQFYVEGRRTGEAHKSLIYIHASEDGAKRAIEDLPKTEKLNDDVTIEYKYWVDNWRVWP